MIKVYTTFEIMKQEINKENSKQQYVKLEDIRYRIVDCLEYPQLICKAELRKLLGELK